MKPYLALLCMGALLASCTGYKKKTAAGKPKEKHSESRIRDFYGSKFNLELPENFNAALYRSVQEWLGVPYKDNACDRSGTDCSGFVNAVYRQVYGITISRNSSGMYKETVRVKEKELKEGGLVFFRITDGGKVNHVGIYLTGNRFAHASSKLGVTINSLDEKYYSKYYYGAGRYR